LAPERGHHHSPWVGRGRHRSADPQARIRLTVWFKDRQNHEHADSTSVRNPSKNERSGFVDALRPESSSATPDGLAPASR
jgi:hypothetical protein